MSVLYLDCAMGAAGDMLAAALSELLPDKTAFIRQFNALGIPDIKVSLDKSSKCGIVGSHFTVEYKGSEEDENLHSHTHGRSHSHGSLSEIERIVNALDISAKLKDDILSVYFLLARAESSVHGTNVDNIHFHEVGTMDALADISAVCMLMDTLKPEKVFASAVNTGSGTVRCAHGILPVPAPATAWLLKDVPIYPGEVKAELCTPTGAALLKYFVSSFGEMPGMTLKAVGYGMGKKDFPQANCLRAMLGDAADSSDRIYELSCNVDDMTGEQTGYALEQFMSNGALDAFTVPIGMKNSRPAVIISVLCRDRDRAKFTRLIFKHTSTLGIRETEHHRYTLQREIDRVDTKLGSVSKKTSRGYGVERSKFEYSDLARLAKENDMSIAQVLSLIEN